MLVANRHLTKEEHLAVTTEGSAGAEYDLRRIEARLNAFPQFMTEIDGVDLHFIHVESTH
jgi:hypothetical protein